MKPCVLFMCVHNAGRSQMAAAYLEQLSGGRARALSAGSEPAGDVHANVVLAMAEEGLDLTGKKPRALERADIDDADVIITMGCGDVVPFHPGKRYDDWTLVDPAGRPLEEVRVIRDDIKQRVRALMNTLPLQ